MRTISATIDIDAPPERVWEVLVDFSAYPEWNPFMREVRGRAEAGARLGVRLGGAGGRWAPVRGRGTGGAVAPPAARSDAARGWPLALVRRPDHGGRSSAGAGLAGGRSARPLARSRSRRAAGQDRAPPRRGRAW